MARRVVIDHDILGWGDENAKQLLMKYDDMLQVGKHPDLPQRAFDDKVAAYCNTNGCDLMTGDAKSFTHFYEAGIKSVNIARYGWWIKGDRPIYLVKIID
ncbi:MAG TPA: hypothetical protein VFE91_05210 [Nitrososphaerales archaeon]|nr:hypothetical protein [Nitrososphaerales archaeon]